MSLMFTDTTVSALNSADQSPSNEQQPRNSNHQQQNTSRNLNSNSSSTCILLDSPPPNPALQPPPNAISHPDHHHHHQNKNQQQQQSGKTTTAAPFSFAQKTGKTQQLQDGETCPFCDVDAAALTHQIRTLQQQVARLSTRVDFSEEKSKQDADKLSTCLNQLDEYSGNLSLVTKWVSTIGSSIPKLFKNVLGEANPNNNKQRTFHFQQQQENSKPPQHPNKQRGTGQKNPSTNVSAILQDEEDEENNFQQQQQQQDGENEQHQQQEMMISVAEVRNMFRSFRDEIIRLRERNEMLEQRVNDAVCKFEGTNAHKLKEEVEGRLRTMLHSLHETMNGSNSPTAELVNQVSSLRTEVEMVRSRSEAANSHRAVLEARLNEANQRLKEISDQVHFGGNSNNNTNTNNNNGRNNSNSQEEIKDLRQAIKELSATVNHRLETERSAREFDAGDIRSQLRVLLRSPSPMARIGGGLNNINNNHSSNNDHLISSASPQRTDF